MKTFRKYVEELGGLGEFSPGFSPDEALLRVAKMAIEDHREELLGFFSELGRRDHRIRSELETVTKDGHVKKCKHLPSASSEDGTGEVVPSSADGLGSEEPNES